MAIVKRSSSRAKTLKLVRRSVSFRPATDRMIHLIAAQEKRSSNQVIEILVEAGIAAREAEKRRFFEVAERLTTTSDPKIIDEAKRELAQMIFGE